MVPNKKGSFINLFLTFLILLSCNNDHKLPYTNPNINGFVPDKETAKRVAEAVWFPIYGSELDDYKPFSVELLDSVWHVKGDRNAEFGGIIHLYISKKDARIHRFKREK